MQAAASAAGVRVVTGDTKVVERGSADKIFINTAGIGVVPLGRNLSPRRMQPEDIVIVSGAMGDHGLAILAQREGLSFNTPVISDCTPLNRIASTVLEAGGDGVRCMRDPTRGGLATTLNELAGQGERGSWCRRQQFRCAGRWSAPVRCWGSIRCTWPTKGKLIAVVAPEAAEPVLAAMRSLPEGQGAVAIGRVTESDRGLVLLETDLGATRILNMLEGEPLPRILLRLPREGGSLSCHREILY